MSTMDLNLLVALDALLQEQSVTRAAEHLQTSPAAMSRTLGRIRRILRDPLLVRAGQRMVLTPRAVELRDEVHAVVERSRALLTPGDQFDPATLKRTFTLQSSDLLTGALTPALLALTAGTAPGVALRFVPETAEGTSALRDGSVDVEIGVLDHLDPETRTAPLTTTRLVGAVRPEHPLARGEISPQQFAAATHISVSRRGRARGPVDDRLAELGLQRRVPVVLPSHTAALLLARDTDLVCLATESAARHAGLRTFEVPLDLPPVSIGMAWHPRNDVDAAHRWLLGLIRRAAAELS
ncbi:DNA-binding transcriptional regulator, LysR family [Saccharopolyspora antimicrobica]|uniref:DNA-binding transcriptional regulator, LysR family n=2 Tax=Saccharopolyspora antimicrobica TaxID=455193 RepID=A0A1I5D8G1_9PSEU|nr:LysR family transcriptional regulator [Saccharopolyspora antimicrobica]SFN95489.1 DNA-binding transcriptional regulator, LysR family [Saccharopolyspora antimicrobica]